MLASVLEEAGYVTRLHAWDFRPGVNFVGAIHRTVDEAERTVVVLSPDYLNSQFGEAEWTAAFPPVNWARSCRCGSVRLSRQDFAVNRLHRSGRVGSDCRPGVL